jgi:hypothetical protein
VFRRTKEAWTHRLVEEAYGDDRTPDLHRAITEQAVRLTKAEARTLTEELIDVVDQWRARTQGGQDDDRQTYHVLQIVQPFPDQPLGETP